MKTQKKSTIHVGKLAIHNMDAMGMFKLTFPTDVCFCAAQAGGPKSATKRMAEIELLKVSQQKNTCFMDTLPKECLI